eukprot:TRINITY_DN3900_c0_g2_i1.p1 TRINITY_DN3900_c0_g2~~TRINITY_DN3900_c0_g2_i1.p1  ORF type:complete len:155 (+),score=37.17 TRINITY_DN3900_c0_g2_i1:239-703(+)
MIVFKRKLSGVAGPINGKPDKERRFLFDPKATQNVFFSRHVPPHLPTKVSHPQRVQVYDQLFTTTTQLAYTLKFTDGELAKSGQEASLFTWVLPEEERIMEDGQEIHGIIGAPECAMQGWVIDIPNQEIHPSTSQHNSLGLGLSLQLDQQNKLL